MSDDQIITVVKLVDQVSDRLKEINKAMVATEAAAKKSHKEGSQAADLHRKSVDALRSAFAKLKDTTGEVIRPGMAALGVEALSVAGAIGAVVAAVKSLGDEGRALEMTATRSGMLARQIRELQVMGARWGVSMDATNASLSEFGEFMDKTARRAPDAMRAWMQLPGLWDTLGLELEKFQGKSAHFKQAEAVLDFLPRLKYSDQKRQVLRMMGLPEDWANYTRETLSKMRGYVKQFDADHPFDEKKAEALNLAFFKIGMNVNAIKDDLAQAFADPVVNGLKEVEKWLRNPQNVERMKTAFHELAHEIRDAVVLVGQIIGFLKQANKITPHTMWENAQKPPPQPKTSLRPFNQRSWAEMFQGGPLERFFNRDVPPDVTMIHPMAFHPGSSSGSRRVEDTMYRAMLHALRDWWLAINAGYGAGGFQPASFNPGQGVPHLGGGGYRVLQESVTPYRGGPTPAGSGPLSSNIPKSRREIAQAAYDELRRAGASKEGAEGVLQNMMDESVMNPRNRHFDQPHYAGTEAGFAHGLLQYGGKDWLDYSSWLKRNYPGASWQDPRLQARWAAEHIKTHDPRLWHLLQGHDRDRAAAGVVDWLAPAAIYRMQRERKYMAGGVAGIARYGITPGVTPGIAPRVTDGGLGKQVAANAGKGLDASASVSIDFKNMPKGVKHTTDHNGLFKTFKVNKGFQMPLADDGFGGY